LAKFVLFFLVTTLAIAFLATLVYRHLAARRVEPGGFLRRMARTWVMVALAAIGFFVIWLVLELAGFGNVLSEAIN
jgi:hypothetical protein